MPINLHTLRIAIANEYTYFQPNEGMSVVDNEGAFVMAPRIRNDHYEPVLGELFTAQ